MVGDTVRQRKHYGNQNNVGRTIARLRKEAGLKQIEVMAQMQTRGVDIPQASLSKLEGQERAATDSELIALADIFGTSIDDLFNKDSSSP